MQARRPIHVADRSTAFMGLQFNDPAYGRPPALAKETFLFAMERVQARREAARLDVSA